LDSRVNDPAREPVPLLPVKRSWLIAAPTSLPLILIVAFGLRIGFAWDYIQHHTQRALSVVPFLFESGNIAYSLAQGHGFASPFRVDTGPTAWMTPVYPLLLSGLFRALGTHSFATFVAAAALNILFSGLASVPIYFAGKRVAVIRVGATAAWIWAFFPNAILLTYESMWDACLAALLGATILSATLALDGSRRFRGWVAYGLLWGVALMTNATLVLLVPFLFGWLFYRARRNKTSAMNPALALGVAILCCVPWMVRNYEVFDAFVPLRSVAGLQLWMGNSEHAQDIWLGTYHPIFNQEERDHYVEVGEIAYMREKRQMALAYMATHPVREAHLMWRRFLAVWAGGTPYPIADFLRVKSLWFRYVLLFNLLASVGALCGIVILFRRRSEYAFPVAVFPLVFPWAYYITLVEPRYRLPIDPAVMLLAAVAILAPVKTVTEEPSAINVESGGR
jgi:4-amino-4-deoxy-L-arabinose transferase-like glycosyltransferase